MNLEKLLAGICLMIGLQTEVYAQPHEIKLPKKVVEIKDTIEKGMNSWQTSNTIEDKEIAKYTIKTTFYYTCIEGDPSSGYSSFYEGVKKEGAGVAKRNNKLWHFYYNTKKHKISKEPLSEHNKRGYRAGKSSGTLDIGDIAVPLEVYVQYANHIGYMKTIKNEWLRVRIKDVGEDIQEREGYIDVDIYAGTTGLALYKVSEKFFYDKYANFNYTTELIITDKTE